MKYKNNIFHKFYFHKFHLQVVFQGATVGICQNFKKLVLKFFSQYYTTKKMGAPKIWWCHQIYPPPPPLLSPILTIDPDFHVFERKSFSDCMIFKRNGSCVVFYWLTKFHSLVAFTSCNIGHYVQLNCLSNQAVFLHY